MIQVLLVDSDPSAREMAGARLGEEPDFILETSSSPRRRSPSSGRNGST